MSYNSKVKNFALVTTFLMFSKSKAFEYGLLQAKVIYKLSKGRKYSHF